MYEGKLMVPNLMKRSDLKPLREIFQKLYDNAAQNRLQSYMNIAFFRDTSLEGLSSAVLSNIDTAILHQEENSEKIFKELAKSSPDLNAIQTLIREGVNCDASNKYERSLIGYAEWRGFPNIAKDLHAAGVRVTPLEKQNSEKLFRELNKDPPDYNTMRAIIHNGVDLNATNRERMTLLHLAALKGYTYITEILLHYRDSLTGGR